MPQGNHPAEDQGAAENRIETGNAGSADAVTRAYQDVQTLKEQIEKLKEQAQKINETPATPEKKTPAGGSASDALKAVDEEAARAAEEAVRRAAARDALGIRSTTDHLREERRHTIQDAIRKEQEAKARLEQKRLEAIEKQKELKEAEKRAARMTTNLRKAEIQSQLNRSLHVQEERKAQLRRKKEQEKQERLRIAMELEKRGLQKREELRLAREQEKLARAQAAIKRRNEAIRLKEEEQKAKQEIERLQAQQRELDRKQREERSEIRRQRRIARKSAELGGGIVNVHGTTVKTEIKPVRAFSVKEFFGFSKRKEIQAAQTEEERQALQEENERIKAEARATAAQLREIQQKRRQNSRLYKKLSEFYAYCERRKKPLLIGFSLLLVFAVGSAGLINYYTAYEYSYGDKKLGYVKNKDDVLQITEMVQSA